MEVQMHAFLISALDGGEWSASNSASLTSGERAPGTHWRGVWVGPRTGVNAVVKTKICAPRLKVTLPNHR
jgi:hypothetical protein